MTAATIPDPTPRPPAKALTQFEFWGRLMVLPYLLIFAVFVLYPVCYGLWLARDRKSVV